MENKALDKPKVFKPSLFDNNWMEKFFNAPLDEFFNLGKVINVPAVNVTETKDEYILDVAAPGLEKTDFKVEMIEDMLTISAEKEREEKEEKNGRFNRREYNYNSWSRSFTLPYDCAPEKIKAEYKKGELKVLIPRTEVKEKSNIKNIAVN